MNADCTGWLTRPHPRPLSDAERGPGGEVLPAPILCPVPEAASRAMKATVLFRSGGDVTDKVNATVKPDMKPAEAAG